MCAGGFIRNVARATLRPLRPDDTSAPQVRVLPHVQPVPSAGLLFARNVQKVVDRFRYQVLPYGSQEQQRSHMKFRKKPVVIEAFQVHPDDGMTRELPPLWLVDAFVNSTVRVNPDGATLAISTLEGVMTACVGDWIIQGVKGELYPCKNDIFQATYEPA